jgi:hypothetical protein
MRNTMQPRLNLTTGLLLLLLLQNPLRSDSTPTDWGKICPEIEGFYEMALAGGKIATFQVYFKGNTLCTLKTGAKEPMLLTPLAGAEPRFEYTAAQDEGTFQISFQKDERGAYTRFRIVNANLKLDANAVNKTGSPSEKALPGPDTDWDKKYPDIQGAYEISLPGAVPEINLIHFKNGTLFTYDPKDDVTTTFDPLAGRELQFEHVSHHQGGKFLVTFQKDVRNKHTRFRVVNEYLKVNVQAVKIPRYADANPATGLSASLNARYPEIEGIYDLQAPGTTAISFYVFFKGDTLKILQNGDEKPQSFDAIVGQELQFAYTTAKRGVFQVTFQKDGQGKHTAFKLSNGKMQLDAWATQRPSIAGTSGDAH